MIVLPQGFSLTQRWGKPSPKSRNSLLFAFFSLFFVSFPQISSLSAQPTWHHLEYTRPKLLESPKASVCSFIVCSCTTRHLWTLMCKACCGLESVPHTLQSATLPNPVPSRPAQRSIHEIKKRSSVQYCVTPSGVVEDCNTLSTLYVMVGGGRLIKTWEGQCLVCSLLATVETLLSNMLDSVKESEIYNRLI